MENTTRKARRCRIHSKNKSCSEPGDRAEVFMRKTFAALLTEIAVGKTEISVTEPARPLMNTSEVRRDIGNRDHMKRPLLTRTYLLTLTYLSYSLRTS